MVFLFFLFLVASTYVTSLRWFVVYLSLIAGVAFAPGWISLQPYLQVGSIIIIGNVTSFGVKLLGLF